MQFQDYYKTLEVDRSASQDEIKKSYRRLSKKYHPDVNAENHDATEKFKKIGEAYEVLKDPDKRKRYDQLGQNWNNPGAQPGGGFGGGGGAGAGWQNVEWNFGQQGRGASGQPSGFSDFFDTFFSQGGFPPGEAGGGDPFRQRGGGGRRGRDAGGARAGEDKEAEIVIPLEDAALGVQRTITLQQTVLGADGGRRVEEKTYNVKVPAGAVDGTRIRLKGEGGKGRGGGKDGDLYLRVKLAPHPRFTVVDGCDLTARLLVAPWEAASGAKVPFATLDGEVKLTLPKGATSGTRLRLKGKGLPKSSSSGAGAAGAEGERGALTVELAIALPPDLSEAEQKLLEQWAQLRPDWDPRKGS